MLSRFALRRAFDGGALKSVKLLSAQPVRNVGTVEAPADLQPHYDPRLRAKEIGAKPEYDPNMRGLMPNEHEMPPVFPSSVPIETQVANIKRAHDIFYGPDRDMKNFPPPKIQEDIEPYNFIIVPTRYCKALYEKIGVSGSYTLFLGTLAMFMSKEITPVDHALPEVWLQLIVGLIAFKKFAPKVEAFMEKIYAERRAEIYENPIAEANASLDADIAVYEKDIWRLNAIPAIFQAKKELIDLQLEVEYRERLAQVYKNVKNRLDYQAERDFLDRKFEQDHMVSWIVENVKKSITPQQEKENISSCIANLKTLSATS